MVFHETALYKDKFGGSIDVIDTASKNLEFVSLDIPEFTLQDLLVDMRIPIVP